MKSRFSSTRKAGEHHSALKSRPGRLAVGGKELPLEPFEATLEWKGSEILLEQARVRTESSEIVAEGVVSPSPLAVGLDLDFKLDTELLDLWEPDWQIRGRVDGRGRLEMTEERLRVEGNLRSEDFDFQEIGPWEIAGTVVLEDEVLRLTPVSMIGYGGTGELEARIELRDGGRSAFRFRFNDLDPTRLTSELSGFELPLSTRVHGEAELSVTNWLTEDAEGRGRIWLLPATGAKRMTASGEIIFALASGTLQFNSKELATSNPRAELSVTGKTDLKGTLDVGYRVELRDLSEFRTLADDLDLPESLPIEIGGSLSADGKLTGTLPDVNWTALLTSTFSHPQRRDSRPFRRPRGYDNGDRLQEATPPR